MVIKKIDKCRWLLGKIFKKIYIINSMSFTRWDTHKYCYNMYLKENAIEDNNMIIYSIILAMIIIYYTRYMFLFYYVNNINKIGQQKIKVSVKYRWNISKKSINSTPRYTHKYLRELDKKYDNNIYYFRQKILYFFDL